MKLFLKALRLTKLNPAISSLLLIVVLSCAAQKTKLDNSSSEIVNAEISRLSSFYDADKAYLNFTSNDYLINFINENETDTSNINYNLSRKLSDIEIQLIFNKEESKRLIWSLKESLFPKIDNLPNNIIIAYDKSSNVLNELERERIFLSNPAITSDNTYALIYYAYGQENSMQGGINLYFKVKNKWKFYKTLHLWIE